MSADERGSVRHRPERRHVGLASVGPAALHVRPSRAGARAPRYPAGDDGADGPDDRDPEADSRRDSCRARRARNDSHRSRLAHRRGAHRARRAHRGRAHRARRACRPRGGDAHGARVAPALRGPAPRDPHAPRPPARGRGRTSSARASAPGDARGARGSRSAASRELALRRGGRRHRQRAPTSADTTRRTARTTSGVAPWYAARTTPARSTITRVGSPVAW